MSESFDPYLKWFGIPTRDRPVHHYRLLAIELFEADAEVIENAADQRMAHLKRFNTGKHSALAEKLLNEVAAAAGLPAEPHEEGEIRRGVARAARRASGRDARGRGNARSGSPARDGVRGRGVSHPVRDRAEQFARPSSPGGEDEKEENPDALGRHPRGRGGAGGGRLHRYCDEAAKRRRQRFPFRADRQCEREGRPGSSAGVRPKRELGEQGGGARHGEDALAARGGRARKQAARWAGAGPGRASRRRAGGDACCLRSRQRVVDRIGYACGEAGGRSSGHRQSAGDASCEVGGTVGAGPASRRGPSGGPEGDGEAARPRRARRRRRGPKRFRPPMRPPSKMRNRSSTTVTDGT